jgi:addiction module RelE/StbE family toxin
MRVQFDPDFYKRYKKANVRIRNEVDRKIALFKKDPYNAALNNHELHEEWQGYRSIAITNDYRALYEAVGEGEGQIAYFVALGTHKELYEEHAE